MVANVNERDKLERLCRYITRPALSEKRLSLADSGNIRYELKTPYRDGTTHVFFEPLDFMAKLAALVPKPRVKNILTQVSEFMLTVFCVIPIRSQYVGAGLHATHYGALQISLLNV